MHYGKRSSRQRPHDAAYSAELQASKESGRALAARYGLNAKTVRKWRQRTTTARARHRRSRKLKSLVGCDFHRRGVRFTSATLASLRSTTARRRASLASTRRDRAFFSSSTLALRVSCAASKDDSTGRLAALTIYSSRRGFFCRKRSVEPCNERFRIRRTPGLQGGCFGSCPGWWCNSGW